MQNRQNKRYTVGSFGGVEVPCDIEIYQEYEDSEPELIPHSNRGERFLREASEEAKTELISQSKNN